MNEKIEWWRELLPFIGWKDSEISIEQARELDIHVAQLKPGSMDAVLIREFCASWFGYGFTFAIKPLARSGPG